MPHFQYDIGSRGQRLSIIIPTYNCAPFLRSTLESLETQGGAISEAEIIVVDDCSADQPEAVVADFRHLSIAFIRNEKNFGPCETFRACVRHASRPWIHVLHGDDVVEAQAYKEFREAQLGEPAALAIFGRSTIIDEYGSKLRDANGHVCVGDPLGPGSIGRLTYNPKQWAGNPVAFAAVLFSKISIETVGTFDCRFTHSQDWNLWWRMAATGRVAYTNAVVAGYRVFDRNHTSTLRRSGQNLQETLVQLRLIEEYHSQSSALEIDRGDLYRPSFEFAYRQCLGFAESDRAAFWANFRVVRLWPAESRNWRAIAHLYRIGIAAKMKGASPLGRRTTHRPL